MLLINFVEDLFHEALVVFLTASIWNRAYSMIEVPIGSTNKLVFNCIALFLLHGICGGVGITDCKRLRLQSVVLCKPFKPQRSHLSFVRVMASVGVMEACPNFIV